MPAQASAQDTGSPDPELQQLQDRITQNPNDLEALQRLSHRLLKAMMLEEAKVLNQRALKVAPEDPESLVHAAVIQSGTGDAPGGMKALEEVLVKHPAFAEGWFFKGMLHMQAGDSVQMRRSFEKFVEHAPEGAQKERIKGMLAGGAVPEAPHP
jgi:cytochrome c-type biogenesis protein CcmH/NrfG